MAELLMVPLRLLENVITHPSRTAIRVRRRLGLWTIYVNGKALHRTWDRDGAVVLAGFVARISAPCTLEVVPTRKEPGEYREFA